MFDSQWLGLVFCVVGDGSPHRKDVGEGRRERTLVLMCDFSGFGVLVRKKPIFFPCPTTLNIYSQNIYSGFPRVLALSLRVMSTAAASEPSHKAPHVSLVPSASGVVSPPKRQNADSSRNAAYDKG